MQKEDKADEKWKTDLKTIINQELRIFLIGKSGSGKSGTGNTLLQETVFESSPSPLPLTTKFQYRTKMIGSRNVVIVDGPGIFFYQGFTEKKMKEELAKATALLAPGPNVFLLVVGLNRFDETEIKAIDMYKKVFGEGLMKYLIIVFTGGDDLDRHEISIHDYVQKFNDDQKKFLASCENRFCSINNVATAASIRESQADEVFNMVFQLERRNEGMSYYENEDFEKAEKEIEKRVQEMHNKAPKSLAHDDILIIRSSLRREIVEGATWSKAMIGSLVLGGFVAVMAFYFVAPTTAMAGMALIFRVAK